MLEYVDPAPDLGTIEQFDQEVIARIATMIGAYRVRLEAGAEPEDAKRVFTHLLRTVLRYVDAGSVASRLGITSATVYRWAKGTFVPPQPFIRAAALRGIEALLEEKRRSDVTVARNRNRPVPDKLIPLPPSAEASNTEVINFERPKAR